jgi:4-hydroxybenzoate polyprenyltransferase
VLKTIRHFLELIRFSHTVFALPFALLAALMAWRLQWPRLALPPVHNKPVGARPLGSMDEISALVAQMPRSRFVIRWQEVVGILLCMVTARSFAMAMNRLADRRLDAANPRTAGRHLPAGILSVWQVSALAAICAVGFVASTLLFLPNRLPVMLSLPVLAFLVGYSYAKRFTALAHFWLGAALAFSPVAAWLAIRGEIVLVNPGDLLPALVLGGAVLAWVAGFDIIYSCQDYESDKNANLHSVPARFGISAALRIAAACHLATVALLACLPLIYPFGWIFWSGIAAVALLLVYEHLLVRPDNLSRVNAAFFNVNAVISIGLLVVGSLDLILRGR